MAESLSNQVYETVIRKILSGEYRPGQVLNRRAVAADLSVSIVPVNEAFTLLQSEGIVQTVPRKGTFVAQLDWRDLIEVTIVRAALEVEAARAYCGKRISLRRQQMLELAATVDNAPPVTFEYLHADVVFHRSLVALAGNRYLASLLDSVMTRGLLLAMEAVLTTHREPITASHRQFVEDLCEATPDTVGVIVRRNIFDAKQSFMELDMSRTETDSDGAGSSIGLLLSVMRGG
jgi:DNA-binding GntR family transcriptional regulator